MPSMKVFIHSIYFQNCYRSIRNILINESGKILLDDVPIKLKALKQKIDKKIVANPNIIFSVQTHTAGGSTAERLRIFSNGDIGVNVTTVNRADAGRNTIQFDW